MDTEFLSASPKIPRSQEREKVAQPDEGRQGKTIQAGVESIQRPLNPLYQPLLIFLCKLMFPNS
jgi:hypothetical protein